MKRKTVDKDISDKEWEKVYLPAQENVEDYLKTFIIPELVSFQIANFYFRGCLCDASFEQHYNSMCDIVNGSQGYIDEVRDSIYKILKIKYNLIITETNPMRISKWQ